MPLYEYQCEACDSRFEVIQKFSDPHTDTCTRCGKGPVRRLPSTPAIQFKGTGWYITDYAQKGKPGGAEGDGRKEGDGKKDGDGKSGDAKETKDGKSAPAESPAASSDGKKGGSTPAAGSSSS